MKWFYRFLLLAVLGLVGYSNAVQLPFVHDDKFFILNNPQIADFWDLKQIFSPATSGHVSSVQNVYYRPLLDLFQRIEFRAFGFNAAGYHALNVVLHILNGLLIFLLLSRIWKTMDLAWMVAALFILHPVQSESVACISGVSNLLSTTLLLMSLLFYVTSFRFESPGSVTDMGHTKGDMSAGMSLVLALFFFLAALLVKESAIVLVGLVFWMNLTCFSRQHGERALVVADRRKIWARFGVFLIVVFVYFLWRNTVLPRVVPDVFSNREEFFLRLVSIPRMVLTDLRILIWPHDLHYYRNIDILVPAGVTPFVLALVVLIVGLLIHALKAPEKGRALWGAGFFGLTLLPVLNIIPIVHEYSQLAAFDHFLYLPALGVFIFAVVVGDFGIRKISGPGQQRVGFWIAWILLLGCLGMTLWYNQFWKNEVILFERMARYETKFGRGYQLLGRAYAAQGNHDRAMKAFHRALTIFLSYAHATPLEETKGIYLNFCRQVLEELAVTSEKKGDFEGSTRYYLEALGVAPKDSELCNRIGLSYVKRQRLDKAKKYFEESIRFGPENTHALNNLAICLIQEGQTAEAVRLLERVLKVDPGFESARQNLEKLRKNIP